MSWKLKTQLKISIFFSKFPFHFLNFPSNPFSSSLPSYFSSPSTTYKETKISHFLPQPTATTTIKCTEQNFFEGLSENLCLILQPSESSCGESRRHMPGEWNEHAQLQLPLPLEHFYHAIFFSLLSPKSTPICYPDSRKILIHVVKGEKFHVLAGKSTKCYENLPQTRARLRGERENFQLPISLQFGFDDIRREKRLRRQSVEKMQVKVGKFKATRKLKRVKFFAGLRKCLENFC